MAPTRRQLRPIALPEPRKSSQAATPPSKPNSTGNTYRAGWGRSNTGVFQPARIRHYWRGYRKSKTTNLFGAAPIPPMYEAIPVIVPALFVIGVVGALIYDRSHRNAE